jgi:hypothetical protein
MARKSGAGPYVTPPSEGLEAAMSDNVSDDTPSPDRVRRRQTADQGDLHRLGRQSRRMVRFLRLHRFRALFRAAFFPSRPRRAAAQCRVLFAAGFIVRPIGGWLFGHLADRYGRRLSLTDLGPVDVLRLADHRLTPTYASIGFAAPAPARAGAHHRGPQPRRRIRRQRHLSYRDLPTPSIAASIRASSMSR